MRRAKYSRGNQWVIYPRTKGRLLVVTGMASRFAGAPEPTQGATAAGLVHSQARRRAVGEITGLPTQSRSGDGSSGITATTGISVWRARRRVGMPALMGRGGELCGHGLPRGSAIGHRALHGCWGIAGRAGRACGRAPPLARVHLCYV